MLLKISISAKFDMTVLAPYLFPALMSKFGAKPKILKKENSYFSVSCGGIVFKDAYLFTSPCSLSKYLSKNQVSEVKSIFPYTAFGSIEEMARQIDFPPHEKFYSDLKGENVSIDEYNLAKSEYDRRKKLPGNHPEKMHNFVDWLRYYNSLDTFPLAKAINNSFAQFFACFKMDPSWVVSLPKYAQNCMFQDYNQDEPYCFSFAPTCDAIRQLFRENLLGGLVNCYHRMTDLSGQEGLPRAAQFAPNGQKFTRIQFFDFNALYLYAQKLPFPATPGIHWEWVNKRGGFFSKNSMAPGVSFGQIQWLLYIEETDRSLYQQDGSKAKLQHAYFQGEFDFHGYKVDGYANVDGRNIFWEFLGCYWHPGCKNCNKYPGEDPAWETKSQYLRRFGELKTIRECVWVEKLKSLRSVQTSFLPQILSKYSNEKTLLEGIRSEKLFGFAVCDVTCPEKTFEEIKSINFPPVIQRGLIDEDLLSPYMAGRCKERGYKLPQKTLIQTYNGKQLLLYTPVIQFYMKLGLVISNVTKFIQYKPAKPLEPFVQKITEGRIAACESGNGPLELAYKIIGNSGYGKLGEAVARYTNTILGDDGAHRRHSRSAFFKAENILTQEDGNHDLIEISMTPKRVEDDKPIAMATAILQNSKLHFLKFVYDVLWKFLRPGSFRLNYADTDSLCICKFENFKNYLRFFLTTFFLILS